MMQERVNGTITEKEECSNEGNTSKALPASFSNVNDEYVQNQFTNVYNYVMNEKCIPTTDTRLTRSQRNKIEGAMNSLSAHMLRMMKQNKNEAKPSIGYVDANSNTKSTDLNDSEEKSFSVDIRNTTTESESTENDSNSTEICTRCRRIASKDVLNAIGKIAIF